MADTERILQLTEQAATENAAADEAAHERMNECALELADADEALRRANPDDAHTFGKLVSARASLAAKSDLLKARAIELRAAASDAESSVVDAQQEVRKLRERVRRETAEKHLAKLVRDFDGAAAADVAVLGLHGDSPIEAAATDIGVKRANEAKVRRKAWLFSQGGGF